MPNLKRIIFLKRKLLFFSLFLLFFTTTVTSYAQSIENEVEKDPVLSTDNVEIIHGNRVLRAKEMSYNTENGNMTAEGEVYIKDEEGNIYRASKADFNGDLTKGNIESLTGTLNDGSRFAADSGARESQFINILKNAVYSPCSLCTDSGKNKRPLWQVSAKKVTMDSEKERISYNHATLDLFGVPIFYTPYLSHASPGAKRKSGFLAPSYGNMNTLGFTLKTPYYINVSPDMDATIEPIFTTDEGVVLSGEFRHLLENGEYELSGSITNPSERDDTGRKVSGKNIRGHIVASGDFDIKDGWSWGFDAKRSTDDTYLQRYQFGNEDVLTSKAYIENIEDRNYFGMQGISFQGLNAADDPSTTPLILPLVNTHYEKKTGYMNSNFSFDGNALVLERDEGVKSKRLSGTAALTIPYITNGGHVFEMKGSVRSDAYHVDNVITSGQSKDGFIGRFIPEAQASWSFPVIKQMESSNVFIEPVTEIIIGPNGGNPGKIPNEDSQELELSDVNLFSNNHFTGYDRVEGGIRSNYGIRAGLNNSTGRIDALFGQNYRAKKDENFTPETGLRDNFSDYVGRLGTTININDDDTAGLSYRFRLDKDDFVLRRNEIGANFSIGKVYFNTRYTLIDEVTESFDTQEVSSFMRIQLTDTLSFDASGRRNLAEGGGLVYTLAGLTYENECIRLLTGWRRDYTRDRDIEPTTSYTFKVVFKHFGGETS